MDKLTKSNFLTSNHLLRMVYINLYLSLIMVTTLSTYYNKMFTYNNYHAIQVWIIRDYMKHINNKQYCTSLRGIKLKHTIKRYLYTACIKVSKRNCTIVFSVKIAVKCNNSFIWKSGYSQRVRHLKPPCQAVWQSITRQGKFAESHSLIQNRCVGH